MFSKDKLNERKTNVEDKIKSVKIYRPGIKFFSSNIINMYLMINYFGDCNL